MILNKPRHSAVISLLIISSLAACSSNDAKTSFQAMDPAALKIEWPAANDASIVDDFKKLPKGTYAIQNLAWYAEYMKQGAKVSAGWSLNSRIVGKIEENSADILHGVKADRDLGATISTRHDQDFAQSIVANDSIYFQRGMRIKTLIESDGVVQTVFKALSPDESTELKLFGLILNLSMNANLGDKAQALMTLKDDMLSIYMKSEDNGQLVIDRFNYRRISPEGSGSPEEKIADSKLVNTQKTKISSVGEADPVYQRTEWEIMEDLLAMLRKNINDYRRKNGLSAIDRTPRLDSYSRSIATSLAKKAESDPAIGAAICRGDLSALEYDPKLSEVKEPILKSKGLINDQSLVAPISAKAFLSDNGEYGSTTYETFSKALDLEENKKFKDLLESAKGLRMGLGLARPNTNIGCDDDLILHIILTPVDPPL